jgi:hypothetical protein
MTFGALSVSCLLSRGAAVILPDKPQKIISLP